MKVRRLTCAAGIVFTMLSSVSGAAPGEISVANPNALPKLLLLALVYLYVGR